MPRRPRTPEEKEAHRLERKAHRDANLESERAKEKARRDAWSPERKAEAARITREWRAKNLEYARQINREARAERMKDPEVRNAERARTRELQRKLADEVIAHYGGRCACCGESERVFLSIDHINNDGAEHRRQIGGSGGSRTYGWLKKNEYPEGFQVLCMNCNHGKARNGGVCPHQAGKFSELSKSAIQTKPVPPT